MALSRVTPILASVPQGLSTWGTATSSLPLPIGRGPLPEAAWLRLVAQLDWRSCQSLNSASGDAHLGTTAALATLGDVRRQGQASVAAALAAFDAEAQQTSEQGQ